MTCGICRSGRRGALVGDQAALLVCVPGCGQKQPFTEHFKDLELGQRRTHAPDRHIYRLAQRMAYGEVVKESAHYHFPISENTVRRMYRRLAGEELKAGPSQATPVIGLDEFSLRKQHSN